MVTVELHSFGLYVLLLMPLPRFCRDRGTRSDLPAAHGVTGRRGAGPSERPFLRIDGNSTESAAFLFGVCKEKQRQGIRDQKRTGKKS